MRKRKPFSVYPRPSDIADVTELAEKLDLNLSQAFLHGFRFYARRKLHAAERQRGPIDSRQSHRQPSLV